MPVGVGAARATARVLCSAGEGGLFRPTFDRINSGCHEAQNLAPHDAADQA
jgi:hypothetical protein